MPFLSAKVTLVGEPRYANVLRDARRMAMLRGFASKCQFPCVACRGSESRAHSSVCLWPSGWVKTHPSTRPKHERKKHVLLHRLQMVGPYSIFYLGSNSSGALLLRQHQKRQLYCIVEMNQAM